MHPPIQLRLFLLIHVLGHWGSTNKNQGLLYPYEKSVCMIVLCKPPNSQWFIIIFSTKIAIISPCIGPHLWRNGWVTAPAAMKVISIFCFSVEATAPMTSTKTPRSIYLQPG